ncbi:Oidioi.mRNA.OKI2018_I69.PAR.g9323.t1.cds [Oikopleura dioica]|uniref:Oidioi.mRNA.OKI2018_I69.PAR.g9323.t1.cds n=1 Tax=Oikopleura dioica TaxID=34765 RepID=A0ABN7RQY1_OIKDI|nr:Oidioi.mRNA.OKI2018_I69.PAR.g9323.t1.cds [Oikopleura dioica]
MLSFINTALIHTFRYKLPLLKMPFYHFHSFVSGAFIMSTELFIGSLPVRFYHFIYSILVLLIYCLTQFALDPQNLHLFPLWDETRLLSSSRNKLKESILTGIFLGLFVHLFLFSLSAVKWLYWLNPTSFVKNEYRVVVKTRDLQQEKMISDPKAKLKYISRVAGMLASADKQLESLRRQSRTSLSTKLSELTEQLKAMSRPQTRQKSQSAEHPSDEYLGIENRNYTM